jgi:hypothetical protein
MLRFLSLFRGPRHWARRAVCLALLALQGGILTSPLWETHTQKEVHPRPHVEQSGARHVDMHDETTCRVCSVRSLASLPVAPQPAIVVARHSSTSWRNAEIPASRDDGPTSRSRAPPLVG